jgi:putative DNA primase/helicase
MLTIDYPQTDLGNAERFVADHRDNARFCHATREWLVWNGQYWRRADVDVYALAKETVRGLSRKAAALEDDEQRQKLMKYALFTESEPRIRAMLRLAEKEPDLAVSSEELDSNAMLFNVQNGTIDLRNGDLHEHRSNDLMTKISPVSFDASAQCPRWNQFLLEVMRGEIKLIDYLQRAVGYSMTGHTKEQVMFMLYGGGANGKTTFLEALRFVFGDYSAVADFNSLMVTKNTGPRNDLAKLQGARFVTASETDESSRLVEPVVKQLTGGDRITARPLYGEFFEYAPQYKFWLGMNHLPTIRGTDEAIWRRIHLIPFEVHISEAKRDRDLLEKLKSEAPGILKWAVDGSMKHQQVGLNPPEAAIRETRKYRDAQDVVAQFIDEKCTLDGQGKIGGRSLYGEYRKWEQSRGEREPMTEKRFSQSLISRAELQKTRGGDGMVWSGITLTDKVITPGNDLMVN